jgi:hypothetical protein
MSATLGFQPNAAPRPATALGMVAVDPTTVTKKEYEDICGIHFTEDMLQKRLEATNFLYPKHVEVINDIAPIAAEMVDDVVSLSSAARVASTAPIVGVSGDLNHIRFLVSHESLCFRPSAS